MLLFFFTDFLVTTWQFVSPASVYKYSEGIVHPQVGSLSGPPTLLTLSMSEQTGLSGRCALKASIPGLYQTTREGNSLEWWAFKGVWESGFLPKKFRGNMEFPLRNGGVPGSDSDLICLSLPTIILKERRSLYPGTSLFTVSQQHPPLC